MAKASVTEESLDWADIKVVDLSQFNIPGEKWKLAKHLRLFDLPALFLEGTVPRKHVVGRYRAIQEALTPKAVSFYNSAIPHLVTKDITDPIRTIQRKRHGSRLLHWLLPQRL